MDIVTIYEGQDKCHKCLGWKRVDGEGLSWKYWEELPAQSAIGVKIGLIKPIECPRCNGTGIEPRENEKEINAIEALKIINSFNRIGNDLDAYLYEIALWGIGERKDKPKKEDYGL